MSKLKLKKMLESTFTIYIGDPPPFLDFFHVLWIWFLKAPQLILYCGNKFRQLYIVLLLMHNSDEPMISQIVKWKPKTKTILKLSPTQLVTSLFPIFDYHIIVQLG